MYYTGTKKKCEEYNRLVSESMGLGDGVTQRWGEVVRHATKSLFAIVAHPDYTLESLKFVGSLSEDWYEQYD